MGNEILPEVSLIKSVSGNKIVFEWVTLAKY